jgi:cytochrome c peroxidase
VHDAPETRKAFRTPTVRNAARTKPYMHNGVFNSLIQLIDFYDSGGGAGRFLQVSNQTLSSDSLHLTFEDKQYLIAFINSLNEEFKADEPPLQLPVGKNKNLSSRKTGGEY